MLPSGRGPERLQGIRFCGIERFRRHVPTSFSSCAEPLLSTRLPTIPALAPGLTTPLTPFAPAALPKGVLAEVAADTLLAPAYPPALLPLTLRPVATDPARWMPVAARILLPGPVRGEWGLAVKRTLRGGPTVLELPPIREDDVVEDDATLFDRGTGMADCERKEKALVRASVRLRALRRSP